MTELPHAGHWGGVTSPGPVPVPQESRPSLEALALALPSAPPALPSELEGRARAFRAMYDAHMDFVWRNLRRLGVPESEAEDRTQEAFVVAHRRFAEFVDRGHGPRAWLFQIVLRVASDARRHHRRHPEVADGGDAIARASVAAPQTDAIARSEAVSRLDAALATLDLGRRAVVVLHEIEEMTAPEIARVLNLPLNTVYSRLRVGRADLELALAKTGDGP